MTHISLQEKYKSAAEVVCKQGMFPFPVNDTTISIMKHVVEDNADELDFICAFNQKSSQTLEELGSSSEFSDEEIAVGHCFCRQRRKILGESCAIDAPVLNCFSFGKSARHTVAQGFAQMVTKDEARNIMKEAEKAGLVHKAFHPGSKVSRPETSICNCCKDCCDTLHLWRDGAFPLLNSTYYLSLIDPDACSGCGICVDRCPTDAIELNDDQKAERDENACFGCGICARFCPEGAISLKEGLRKVTILPPRLRQSN